MDKLLRNEEAEQALIAYILRHPGEYKDLTEIVKVTDFAWEPFMWAWACFGNLTSRGILPDAVCLADELEKLSHLKDFGLPGSQNRGTVAIGYIRDLETTKSAKGYARIVHDFARRRQRLAELTQEAKEAADTNIPLPEDHPVETARYVVHTAAEALAIRPPIEWIVEGLIYRKSVVIMYGDGGTKKTWTAMHLASCVASGVPWGDYQVKRCKVLFIDEENGEEEIAGRAGFCLRGALGDESSDLSYISLAAFHLDNPEDAEILTQEIIKQGAELVVFDALADLMVGDENTKQDTQPVFNALRKIAERTGAALLIIHHANKMGTHRGSSVIKDAPDILLQVVSDPDSLFINFKTEKNRKGKAFKWSMKATWLEDSFYLSNAEPEGKPEHLSKSQDYVIRYLTEHGASSLPDIEGAADVCTSNSARQAVYSLVNMGKAKRINPGEKTSIYNLIPQGD
jgi:hypothetical protein